MADRSKHLARGLGMAIPALALLLAAACKMSVQPAEEAGDGWCRMPLAAGDTATVLGAIDYNAGYNGLIAPVRKGERLVVHGRFPHARYASFMVYDEKLMAVDGLTDLDLVPVSGVNPFLPGADRSGQNLGEFEVQVRMEAAPAGQRPVNTLYAGLSHAGKPNHLMALAYRVYLPDQGLGFRDHHPLAVTGGVEAPRFKIFRGDGSSYCPNPLASRVRFGRLMLSILRANHDKLKDPARMLGEPHSPPVWLNNASFETQRQSTYVVNDDTRYLATPVSIKFGELLVLRWKAARTPEGTYLGRPFLADPEMRYWSISFNYLDPGRPLKVYGEKTVADVDAPTLPDGSRQIVIGFGGIPRPAAVPVEQWVSVRHAEGFLIMRNIRITPGYAGDFAKLAPGPIPLESDRFTPGGVYCSAAEFAHNPDLALGREQLLKQPGKP